MRINFPDPKQAAITLASQAIVAGAFTYGKFTPLKVTEESIKSNGSEYYGVPTLTSLALKYKDKSIVLLECIITVNQEKNIVTTPMQGRDGTVKEYISNGDYSMAIEAAICSYEVDGKGDVNFNKSQAYPLDEIKKLVGLLEAKDTLMVQSDYLSIFDIKNAVVKSYSMVQETHSNRQALSIQMLSDPPYEIKMKQDAAINK